MKRYSGGQAIPKGVYLKLSTGEFVQLYGDVRVLPGGRDARYLKVPAALAAVAGPFIGLAFVIFLPMAGIAGILGLLGYRGWKVVSESGRRALQPVAVGWRPGRAYLTRKGGAEGKKKPVRDSDFPNMSITEIEDEIARRRSQGEQ